MFLMALIPIMIWETIWKGIGLWKSGRNNQFGWFIFMFIFNTAGILPLIYLLFFQKNNELKKKVVKNQKVVKKKK
jgi:methionyl-tRNA synthetase